MATIDTVQKIYVAFFNRPADALGAAFWASKIDGGMTEAQVAASFAASAEYKALYSGMDTANIVATLYTNLFGRTAAANEVLFWGNRMLQGLETVDTIALKLANSAQGSDATAIADKIAASEAFTNGLDTTAKITGYSGLAANASARTWLATVVDDASLATATSGVATAITNAVTINTTPASQSFTLTTGIDTPVGGAGNDTFTALDNAAVTANNWGALDTIDGGAGTDTFTVASALDITVPAGATVKNIEKVVVAESGANKVVTLDTTGWTGLTSLVVTQGGTGTDTLTATATTDVTNTGASTGAVDIIGGNNVTVTTAGGNVRVGATATGGTTAASPAGAISVTDTNSAASTIAVDGGTTVTITEKGATGAAAINVGANVKATGAVTVDATTGTANGNAIGTITVTGGTSVTVTEHAGNAGATGTDTTEGNVVVNGGSTTTTVTVSQDKTATGASAVAAIAGVNAVAAVTAAPGVTGVSAVTGVAAQTASAAVVGTTAGSVQIQDANYNTTGTNTIANVTLSNYAAGSFVKSNALTNLTLKGKGGTLAITNATNGAGGTPTTNSTLNLAVDTLSGTNTVTDTNNEITTLNVTATNSSTLAAFVDTGLKTLNVSGTGTFKLSTINSSLTALNVSGSASFNDGGTTAANGLAALGAAVTITDTSSGTFTASLDDTTQTFTGGTGRDIITISATADATKAITAGSATNDELILEGGAYALTSATAAKVTGFEILGVAANVTGTIDMSVLAPTVKTLDIIGNSTIAFTKVATGAAVNLDANSTSVSVTYVDANGVNDSTTVTIGASTNAAAITATALTLKDGNNVGIGTLNVVSNDSTFNDANVITTLTDNGLANLNVSGNAGLTITTLNEATTQATSFTLNNTETGAAGVTITTFTDNNLGNLVFKGTNASTITTLNDTGAVLSISNTGSSTAKIGTLTDANLTSLTLGAGVSLGQAATADATKGLQDSSTAGVTVSGASDNAHVTINLSAGAAAGNTDSITLGNGNDFVVDASTAGTVNVTVGTGSNLIKVASGGNNATFAANVTLGAHTSTTGSDSIFVSAIGSNTGANTVITGIAVGDSITFTDTTAGTVATVSLNANTYASVAAGLTAAHANTAAHGVATFLFGGNTYVVQDVAAATAAATSTVIELIGVHTVSSDTAGVITILT